MLWAATAVGMRLLLSHGPALLERGAELLFGLAFGA